jgi:ABC-2 type transport system permease protein
MRFALHAEWTKLRTSPGTLLLLLAIVAGTIGVSAAAATCPAQACGADLPKLSLTGVQLGQAVTAIFAVMVLGNEYSTGMVSVTLAAMPRRSRVLAAKTAVVAAVVAAAAAAAVAGSIAVGRLLRSSHDLPTLDVMVRPAVGSLLYLVLVGVLSLGVTALVRNGAAAIGVVLTLLYGLPIVTSVVTDPTWRKHLEQIGPATAGLAVQVTAGDPVIGPWKGLGVLALWSLGALLGGAAVLNRWDA